MSEQIEAILAKEARRRLLISEIVSVIGVLVITAFICLVSNRWAIPNEDQTCLAGFFAPGAGALVALIMYALGSREIGMGLLNTLTTVVWIFISWYVIFIFIFAASSHLAAAAGVAAFFVALATLLGFASVSEGIGWPPY